MRADAKRDRLAFTHPGCHPTMKGRWTAGARQSARQRLERDARCLSLCMCIYNWVEVTTSLNDPGQEGWPCRVRIHRGTRTRNIRPERSEDVHGGHGRAGHAALGVGACGSHGPDAASNPSARWARASLGHVRGHFHRAPERKGRCPASFEAAHRLRGTGGQVKRTHRRAGRAPHLHRTCPQRGRDTGAALGAILVRRAQPRAGPRHRAGVRLRAAAAPGHALAAGLGWLRRGPRRAAGRHRARAFPPLRPGRSTGGDDRHAAVL
jgi:hypothetical protein